MIPNRNSIEPYSKKPSEKITGLISFITMAIVVALFTLVYLISPIDFLPGNPIDDLGILVAAISFLRDKFSDVIENDD
ncbi:hypothetical protein HWHPT5561_09380 [Petrotoga sp. HWH.PT.55.6.1]|uniref:DUF1232 domain-containing protein n=1 Tax=unclassified Petrotoga TaxID=2620614 RepID=UPI000CA03944|nr:MULTISPECIES: DUF1232 domain-containing protein [unclassified Petrotoga]PNR88513.1 hypothetical protein X925_06245 [Petrotoga sp. 9T1HF07.CasAA.8.2]PNR94442.1 hypothetical protein X926_00440 [Petrotoga sp. HWHPT.55.6.3]RLL85639.1 hypothetical protein BZ25_01730 [Petrotoga sp. Shatin.DS.tank11.9.2.9.3]RPD35091.1 hypothetical protein HWHPT5561_09380 [Petrotoga sp. HWH.PT.55.6.1]